MTETTVTDLQTALASVEEITRQRDALLVEIQSLKNQPEPAAPALDVSQALDLLSDIQRRSVNNASTIGVPIAALRTLLSNMA